MRFRSHGLSRRCANAVLAGWQLNTIANFSSGTPFTVYDSANVALQGSSPEITGFYFQPARSDRRSQCRPHTRRSMGEPLGVPASRTRKTQAGQFGSEGRNAVRGPGIAERRSLAAEDDVG